MTLGCFSGGFFFIITLICSFVEPVLSSTSSLIQSLFIVFPYDFQQAKHIQQFNFNSSNFRSCNYNMSSSSSCVSRKRQLCEGRHRGGSCIGCFRMHLSHKTCQKCGEGVSGKNLLWVKNAHSKLLHSR